MPPSKRRVIYPPAANVAGLSITGDSGGCYYPLPTVPFNPWESYAWGSVEASIAAAQIGQPGSVRPSQPGSSDYLSPVRGPGGILPVGHNGSPVNGLRPRWVVAINTYSPVAHRNPPGLRDTVPPRAVSARGVAVPTQRPRPFAPGRVTTWPVSAPRWPTFAESPNARG